MRQYVHVHVRQLAEGAPEGIADPVDVGPATPGRGLGEEWEVPVVIRREEGGRESGKCGADGGKGAAVEGVPGCEGQDATRGEDADTFCLCMKQDKKR